MVESIEAAEQLVLWLPIAIFIGSVLLGLFLEYVMLRWLLRLTSRTDWQLDDIFINAFRGIPLIWLPVLGFYLAANELLINPRFVGTINDVFNILVILSLTLVVMRVATGYVAIYANKQNLPSVSIFNNIIRITISLLGLMFVMQYFAISITPLLTAVTASSVGLAFALREPLGNLFAGLLIVASNQFQPGNYVRLSSGEEGYVTDIYWHTTNLRQLSNNIIVVPNSVMTTAVVINYDRPENELSVLFDLGVSYQSDLEHVERVTLEVASEVMQEVTGGVVTSEPFMRYNEFADFSINFTVIMRGQQFVDQYLIKHEFVKRLHRRYNAEGIDIPFPIRTLHSPSALPLEVHTQPGTNGHGEERQSAERGQGG